MEMLAVLSDFTAEGIFGGVILLALLTLLFSGKLRLEREVRDKDKIIDLKDKTISEQSNTIKTLISQAEVTNTLLGELRESAQARDN